MKIAILSGRDPKISTDTDGGSVYLEYLQSKLINAGHTVSVFLPQGIQGAFFSKKRVLSQTNGHIHSDEHNTNVYYFPINKEAVFKEGSSNQDYFINRLQVSLSFVDFFSDNKLHDYDLVFILHCANALGLVQYNLIPFERTVLFPMMTTAHYELFTTVPEEYTKAEKIVFDKIQHISTPSNNERNALINNFSVDESKVFVTHRGFSPNDFPYVLHEHVHDSKKIHMFSANGIRPQKDHMFFIDLCLELKKQGVTPQLSLTGNNGKSHSKEYNEYTESFWKRAKDTGVIENIKAFDVIPRSELVDLLHESDVAVYPSISETFGKSALESAASGVPTFVCDDVPAYGEFIKHDVTGVIAPRDATRFSEIILDTCITNVQKYKNLSENGKSLRNRFSWDSVFKTFFEQLKSRGIM